MTEPVGTADHAIRLTVNLTKKSTTALDSAVRLTGDSKTDTINRALQTYRSVCKAATDASYESIAQGYLWATAPGGPVLVLIVPGHNLHSA